MKNVVKSIISALCICAVLMSDVSVVFADNDIIPVDRTAIDQADAEAEDVSVPDEEIVEHEHSLQYADNYDGTHLVYCETCEYEATEEHTYDENGVCVCGATKEDTEDVSGEDKAVSDEADSDEIDVTQDFDLISVNVKAPAGVFPKGTTIKIEQITVNTEEIEENLDADAQIMETYSFDIKAIYRGEEIQPDTEKGNVSVTFHNIEYLQPSEEVSVFHVDEDLSTVTEEVETVERTEDGEVVAEVEHFSVYSVVLYDGNSDITAHEIVGTKVYIDALLDNMGFDYSGYNYFCCDTARFSTTGKIFDGYGLIINNDEIDRSYIQYNGQKTGYLYIWVGNSASSLVNVGVFNYYWNEVNHELQLGSTIYVDKDTYDNWVVVSGIGNNYNQSINGTSAVEVFKHWRGGYVSGGVDIQYVRFADGITGTCEVPSTVTDVTFEKSVETIGAYHFKDTALTNINFYAGSGAKLTTIGDYAFSYCPNLATTVVIPDGVVNFGENVFYSSKTKNITIPSSVKTIGDYQLGLDKIVLNNVTLTSDCRLGQTYYTRYGSPIDRLSAGTTYNTTLYGSLASIEPVPVYLKNTTGGTMETLYIRNGHAYASIANANSDSNRLTTARSSAPTTSGKKFLGYVDTNASTWSVRYIDESMNILSSLYDITDETNIYQAFQTVYTATLAKDGGTGGTDSFYVCDGKAYSNNTGTTQITSVTIPTKSSYIFMGYKDSNGNTVVSSTGNINTSLISQVSGGITLTAQWKADSTNTITVCGQTFDISTALASMDYGNSSGTKSALTPGGDIVGDPNIKAYTFGTSNNATLVLAGTGEMAGSDNVYVSSTGSKKRNTSAKWPMFKNTYIKTVYIDEGITSIGQGFLDLLQFYPAAGNKVFLPSSIDKFEECSLSARYANVSARNYTEYSVYGEEAKTLVIENKDLKIGACAFEQLPLDTVIIENCNIAELNLSYSPFYNSTVKNVKVYNSNTTNRLFTNLSGLETIILDTVDMDQYSFSNCSNLNMVCLAGDMTFNRDIGFLGASGISYNNMAATGANNNEFRIMRLNSITLNNVRVSKDIQLTDFAPVSTITGYLMATPDKYDYKFYGPAKETFEYSNSSINCSYLWQRNDEQVYKYLYKIEANKTYNCKVNKAFRYKYYRYVGNSSGANSQITTSDAVCDNNIVCFSTGNPYSQYCNLFFIGNGAMAGADAIQYLPWTYMPGSYTNYYRSSTYYRNLRLVYLDDRITSIGAYNFANATSATWETPLPSSLTRIENNAFTSGGSVPELPNNLGYIGDFAFSQNTYINYDRLPDSVYSIGNYAFNNCIGLTITELPNNLESIGTESFVGCSNIQITSLPGHLSTFVRDSGNGHKGPFHNDYPNQNPPANIGIKRLWLSGGYTAVAKDTNENTLSNTMLYSCIPGSYSYRIFDKNNVLVKTGEVRAWLADSIPENMTYTLPGDSTEYSAATDVGSQQLINLMSYSEDVVVDYHEVIKSNYSVEVPASLALTGTGTSFTGDCDVTVRYLVNEKKSAENAGKNWQFEINSSDEVEMTGTGDSNIATLGVTKPARQVITVPLSETDDVFIDETEETFTYNVAGTIATPDIYSGELVFTFGASKVAAP